MFNVVLYQPEIPPNTGNIIRLCANTGCRLHLIKPLGFELSDKLLKRAGLDYHAQVSIQVYESFEEYLQTSLEANCYFFSSKATNRYSTQVYKPQDSFIFGSETRGLPASLLVGHAAIAKVTIPMQSSLRSLNLSNAVAVAVYEAWRQLDFSSVEAITAEQAYPQMDPR